MREKEGSEGERELKKLTKQKKPLSTELLLPNKDLNITF